MEHFLELHSSEVMILLLTALILTALLVLVPQLLRSHHRSLEMMHLEHMTALEKGKDLPQRNDAVRAAGRTAALVPMVSICASATVTCFMAVCKSDSLFSVSLAVWAVSAIISLAAITGGVALMGRLAQLQVGDGMEKVRVEGGK
jgi:hypothetical protein